LLEVVEVEASVEAQLNCHGDREEMKLHAQMEE
jgi:hypothetical protein